MTEEKIRGRGRPRDMEKDLAIRDAFWSVLSRRGYEGLTFEEVAEVAECSRATLYRRFSSKLALVTAILDETSRSIESELPDDIDPREAFRAHIAGTATYMAGKRGPAILSLSAAAARIPELRRITESYKTNERRFYYDIFRRIIPGISEERMSLAFDIFVGAMMSTIIMCGRSFSEGDEQIVMNSIIYILSN
jgi:AcrR family transcriptional regulator